jgi:ADP-ribose pyrophosphatase YjhB (NUDIX family)
MSNVPEILTTPVYCQRCGRFLVERFIPSEKRSRLQCEACAFIHYMNPRVVASIIVSHRGRLLLQQRANDPRAGFWTFPGGFLEIGETPEDGAARETKEEVGLDLRPQALLGVYGRPQVGIVLVVYEAESDTEAALVGDDESLQVRWFAIDEIPWTGLAFETTEAALRDWAAKHTKGVTL